MSYILKTIKEGQRDYSPPENPFRFAHRVFLDHVHISGRFTASCWHDYKYIDDDGETKVDRDKFDWNKLGGPTDFWSPNDVDNSLGAWRPGEVKNTFELTAYSNIGTDKRKVGGQSEIMGVVKALQQFDIYIFPANARTMKIQVITPFANTSAFHVWRKNIGWLRMTGLYHGGLNNSAGPFGGGAPQDMQLYWRMDVQRKWRFW